MGLKMLLKEDREILMEEHRQLLEEILHRRRNTWVIHSILLTATFLISFTASERFLPWVYITSLLLVSFSWFLQYSAGHVNKSCWKRRDEIKKKIGMEGPKRRYIELQKTYTYKLRRLFWPLIFLFFMILYAIFFFLYLYGLL